MGDFGRFLFAFPRLKHVSDRRSLELEGYTTDITHLREKVRKFEHVLVTFKATQLHEANTAATAAYEDDIDRTVRRGAKVPYHDSTTPRPGTSPSKLPSRVQATFELLGEDVRQLQAELADMAKKINTI